MALFSRLNRRIHLAARCDRMLPAAESFAARCSIPHALADYGTMLEAEPLDAVPMGRPPPVTPQRWLARPGGIRERLPLIGIGRLCGDEPP